MYAQRNDSEHRSSSVIDVAFITTLPFLRRLYYIWERCHVHFRTSKFL